MSTAAREAVVWRYLPRSKRKHALIVMGKGHKQSALCGTAPTWHASSTYRWRGGTADTAALLEQLAECSGCVCRLT